MFTPGSHIRDVHYLLILSPKTQMHPLRFLTCLPLPWPPGAAVLHFASWCCSTALLPHGWAAAISEETRVVTNYSVTPTLSLLSSVPYEPATRNMVTKRTTSTICVIMLCRKTFFFFKYLSDFQAHLITSRTHWILRIYIYIYNVIIFN